MKDVKNYLKDLAKMKKSKTAVLLFTYDLIDFIDETTLIDFVYSKTTIKSKKTIDNKDIEELVLNNCDIWTGKTDQDLIVEKINEIIKCLKKIKNTIDNK